MVRRQEKEKKGKKIEKDFQVICADKILDKVKPEGNVFVFGNAYFHSTDSASSSSSESSEEEGEEEIVHGTKIPKATGKKDGANHNGEKPVAGQPRRPLNPFFEYLKDFREAVKGSEPSGGAVEISKLAGFNWKGMNEEEKSIYRQKFEISKLEYKSSMDELANVRRLEKAENEAKTRKIQMDNFRKKELERKERTKEKERKRGTELESKFRAKTSDSTSLITEEDLD